MLQSLNKKPVVSDFKRELPLKKGVIIVILTGGVINSSADVIAGVLYFIPHHPYAKIAVGVLGYLMSKFPGDMVFNTAPNYLGSQTWSVAYQ